MPTEMNKTFDPASFEDAWQKRWDELGIFRCPEGPQPADDSYCILIPPPNVTGKLHIGHALQSTLQDLLVRWQRMLGNNALWLPGTDHAGIATQLMVERQVEAEGTTRVELGREAFLERVWQWKDEYHGNIRKQLETLGASCDWSRERFTMDEGLSVAVRTAFVELYREGLISRGEYMVNWSPVLQTAISDLEVESRTIQGKLHHFSYPVIGQDRQVVVATTRPETMLGDTAVAVHPDDERYGDLVGATLLLPLMNREIPVVADEHVDPEFGTGAVKVTPFHDPNDFEIGQRHDLPGIRVIGFDGHMTEEAGAFAGLDRFDARKSVLEALEAEGRLVKIEPHEHAVGHSQRGGEPVEPMISTQWFCDVEEMAAKALAAVEDGDLKLYPSSYDKTWRHWLENIRPWVISRQLWWGHQIPAWYDSDGEIYVAMSREEAEAMAGTSELTQDTDVLDTWFSSGLWPLSTLGWPESADDLQTFYPTDVLVTGHDILFFWVARMVMMSQKFSGEVPFREVHLTGLVRDAKGEKMSKTKGNTLDPMDLVEEFGADALRFTLAALDSPGRDIPLDLERMAGYRAFGNKIWNATRFVLSRIPDDARVRGSLSLEGLELPERYIVTRLSQTAEKVNAKLVEFRFDEACDALYHFFWGELCDWYIEFCKPAFSGEAPRPQVGDVLATVLDRSLRLLHPVMPHLTEELWSRLPGVEELGYEALAVARYPQGEEGLIDPSAVAGIELLQAVVTRSRALRKERNLKRQTEVQLFLEGGDGRSVLIQEATLLQTLGGVSSVREGKGPEEAARDRIAGLDLAFAVAEEALSEDAKARLEKELEAVAKEISGAEARLSNPGFLDKAPAQVVEGSRARLAELRERREALERTLGNVG